MAESSYRLLLRQGIVDLRLVPPGLRQLTADLASATPWNHVVGQESIPPAAPQEPYTGPVQLMERTPEGKWRPDEG